MVKNKPISTKVAPIKAINQSKGDIEVKDVFVFISKIEPTTK